MRTIAHISDLHLGRLDAPIAEGLVRDLADRSPTVLVASGDFTQRARPWQFRAAAELLNRLPAPHITVPGNHDVPLYDVARRMFWPLSRYRRHISADLWPEYRDEALLVLGVNTARSFTWTGGRISLRQLEEIHRRMAAAGSGVFKVLVTHHPFIPSPRYPQGDILQGASSALAQLEASGVDMLLAGHLHRAYHDDVRSSCPSVRRSILSIQAGTATSTRRRGEPNAYNWIAISPELVTVAVRTWNGAAFEESMVARYRRINEIWRPENQAALDPGPPDATGSGGRSLERQEAAEPSQSD